MQELAIDVQGARLTPPTDAQIETLARRAARPGAILPAEDTHFVKWIDGRTPDEIAQQRAERMRSNRGPLDGPGWTLDLAVVVDDEPVGLQSLSGFDQWPSRRVVGTTSWLLSPFQGRGLGTRCRAAVLELAFAHLDAETAKSWALEANHASNTVSARLGYEIVNRHEITEQARTMIEVVYAIAKQTWMDSVVRQHFMPTIVGVP